MHMFKVALYKCNYTILATVASKYLSEIMEQYTKSMCVTE